MRRLSLLLSVLPLLLVGAAPPRATVYVFLAPTCPISQAVAGELRTLHATYAPRGIAFVGVIPDSLVTAPERAEFGRKYQLRFPLQPDPAHRLTRRLGATITPEAALINPQGALLYRGRINDQFARIGVRRTVSRRHELADALAAVVAGRPVAVPRTEAVGCLIER